MEAIRIHLIFFGIQMILGAKGSLAYGLYAGVPYTSMFWIIFICHLIMLYPVYHIIYWGKSKADNMEFMKKMAEKQEDFLERTGLARTFTVMGKAGMLLSTALPLLGGVWSGVIIGHLMGISKRDIFIYVTIGAFFSAGVYVLIGMGVISFIKII